MTTRLPRLVRRSFAFLATLAALIPCGDVTAQQAGEVDELETVLVTGEHPGPGLWKVSRGDNVMWVLGTYGPLPRGMTWRSQAVESRIAESKEVLLPAKVGVDVDIGFFRTLSLVPAVVKSVRLPDKTTLRDVLPAPVWEQWAALRAKYHRRGSSLDRMRPSMAVSVLRDEAHKVSRLTDGPVVQDVVRSLAKKHKVRVRSLRDVEPEMKIKPDDIRMALSGLRDAADVECFTRDLAQLEPEIALLKLRANAWAAGDVGALRNLHEQPDLVSACDQMFEDTFASGDSDQDARIRELGARYDRLEAQARERAREEWITAARKALDRNSSTFALLPIREVVAADGYVSRLKELGYEVEGQ